MTDSIKVFAIDNMLNDNYDLPFIRLGRYPFSNACINDNVNDNVVQFGMPLDVANAIWWVYKNYKQFGKTDYVGFCHYRRYLTHHLNLTFLPIQDNNVDKSLITTPEEQLAIITQNNLDGLTTFPMYEDFFKNPNSKGYGIVSDYKYCWEGTYYQFKTDNVGLSMEDIKLAYDKLYEYSPDYLKLYMLDAFTKKQVHFCSIFTLSYDLFELYCNVVLKAMFFAIATYDVEKLKNSCNCRVGGYLLERLGSTFFYALKNYGKRIASLCLIESMHTSKPNYRTMTCKDANLELKSDEFKKYIIKEFEKHD